MMPNWFFDHLQLFLVLPFFDQVPNKGSAILNPCQSWTKMEESRLWGSYLGWVHCKSPNLLQPSLQVTLFQSGEKSMSTPLLLAPLDFLTFLRPWQRWKGKPDSCSLASRHDFEYSSVTSHDDIAIHSLQEVYLQGNTTYIQGDLTPNFLTFSKRILNY